MSIDYFAVSTFRSETMGLPFDVWIFSRTRLIDYKRRPLSEEERKPIKGIYPYYGAMSVVDHINQYLFDGTFLLFSEDGANVIDEYGHPALQ